jgi:transposase
VVGLLRASGRSVPRLARELGCSPRSLRDWARRLDVDAGRAGGPTSDEGEELGRLGRAVRALSEERAIIGEAAALVAKAGENRR